jgi:hypothetical protein
MIANLEKKPPKGKVRILPVPGHYIPGVPDVAQDLDPEEAAAILAYTPAAFVLAEPEPAPTKAAEE